jgi:hypothetical protein
MKRVVLLTLALLLAFTTWWLYPSHVAAQISANDAPAALSNFRTYTFTGLTNNTVGQNWTLSNSSGQSTTVSDLSDFRVTSFSAYNAGGFPSGQNVTLLFGHGGSLNTTTGPLVLDEVVSGIVDQLDGDLYMKGQFTASADVLMTTSGWHPGIKGFVQVAPLGPGVFIGLAQSQAITIVLSGWCNRTDRTSCPGYPAVQ